MTDLKSRSTENGIGFFYSRSKRRSREVILYSTKLYKIAVAFAPLMGAKASAALPPKVSNMDRRAREFLGGIDRTLVAAPIGESTAIRLERDGIFDPRFFDLP